MTFPGTDALPYGAATHPGLKRANNEDCFRADPESGLFLVVDGVGGHVAGQVASNTVASAIAAFTLDNRGETDKTWPFGIDPLLSSDANCLRMAILLANQAVANRVRQDPTLAGMAATLSAALLSPTHAVVANVGDCRAYALRRGSLVQITTDHSWVAEQVAAGTLNAEEARVHPMRNLVTRALAGEEELDVDLVEFPLEPGDVLLLCSDGLHGVVTDDAIRSILVEPGVTLETACERLIEAALAGGGPDNVTVVAVASGMR